MERMKLGSIEAEQYIGEKTSIEKAYFITTDFGPAVKIESTPITLKGDDKLAEGKELRASNIFSLGEVNGKVVVPEDGNLDNFMKKKKVDIAEMPEFVENEDIPCLIAVDTVVQVNKKGYLEMC